MPCFSRRFKSRYITSFELVYYLSMLAFRFFAMSFDSFSPPFLCYDVIFISPLLFLRFFVLYIYSVLVMGLYQIRRLLKFSPCCQLSSEASRRRPSSWLSSGPFPRCLSLSLALALRRSPLSSVPSRPHLSLAVATLGESST